MKISFMAFRDQDTQSGYQAIRTWMSALTCSTCCNTEGQQSKTDSYSALDASGKNLPAQHVQNLCLAIGRHYGPGESISIDLIGEGSDWWLWS